MKIQVSYGETINTGNYESKKINLSIERDVNPNEDVDTAISKEFNYLTWKLAKLKEMIPTP